MAIKSMSEQLLYIYIEISKPDIKKGDNKLKKSP